MAGGGGESPHRGTKHWRGDLGPPCSLPRTSKDNDHYHFQSSDDPLPIFGILLLDQVPGVAIIEDTQGGEER